MAREINFKKAKEESPRVGDYIIKDDGDIFRIICNYNLEDVDEYYLLREEDGYIEDLSRATSIDSLLYDINYTRIVRNGNTRLEEI